MNYSLFEIHKDKTASGARLLVLPMKSTGTVTLMVFVGTGSRHERPEQSGVSHFLEHLFFKGSKKRPSTLQISEALDEIGGEFNAFTSKETTAFYAKAAAMHVEVVADVLGDMLLRPLFDPKEINRERGVVIEEMNMYEDTPLESIGENFEHLIFGDHELGRKIIGTKEIISSISRKTIMEYMRRQYTSGNVVVCLAGNVDPNEGMKLLKKQFKNFKAKEGLKANLFNDGFGERKVFFQVKKTDQAHVVIGGRGTSYSHEDRCAVDLLAAILGGSMSSRLFIEVRERRGLCYSVHTGAEHFTDTGYIATQMGVDPANTQKALAVILKETRKIRETPVQKRELQKAKENYKGRMLIRLESSNSVAQFIGGQELLTGRIQNLNDIFKCIDSVTPEDVRRVARKYLAPEFLRVAAIAPNDESAAIEAMLK